MKRIILLLLSIFLLVAKPAAAHGPNLTALVSVNPSGAFALKLVDPYGSPITEILMKAAVAPSGASTDLVERAPGIYEGNLGARGDQPYEIKIEATLASEPFRASVTVGPGKELVDQPVLLIEEVGGSFIWEMALYGVVVVCVTVVLVVATFRRPKEPGSPPQ
jgi:hypothetical protein